MSSYELKPIAHIKTPFTERFGTPRQPGLVTSATGRIVFEPDFAAPGYCRGLEAFSHIWLTFIFDRTEREGPRMLVRPPRLGGNNKVGVFASRSPYRPNALGLTAVELVAVGEGELLVSGVDLTDGTPILDIRPYISYTDAVPAARCGYAAEAPEPLGFDVSECRSFWDQLDADAQDIISQTLTHDPAPAFHPDGRVYRLELRSVALAWKRSEGVIHLLECRRMP